MNPGSRNQKFKRKCLEEIVIAEEKFTPFIVLTETHFNEEINDAEIQIKNFNIFRADRTERKCGGTAIYLHNTIAADNIERYSDSVCESLMIFNKTLELAIISIYRPPRG